MQRTFPVVTSVTTRQLLEHPVASRSTAALLAFVLAPATFYLAIFSLLTYPLMLQFTTAFFADAGDGMQFVWNIWWVNYALTVLHQSPWYTAYLHYPAGVTLLTDALNPFNGLVAVGLLRFATLVEAHNTMVVFSFVMGGVGAFWLSYEFSKNWLASLIGGSIFTFSQYHFAHAEGHLNLVSLEWIPVFALLWYRFLRNPRVRTAVVAAVVLLLTLLCDYYYFFYSVLFAAITGLYEAWHRRDIVFLVRGSYLRPFAVFVVVAAVGCGPLIARLLVSVVRDPVFGAHEPDQFSTDLLAAFIPGAHWRFAELTKSFWEALGNINENSVAVGITSMAALSYLVAHKSQRLVRQAAMWWIVLVAFWLLSLGPVLHFWGRPLVGIPMPYTLLEVVAPPLALSGVPVRMMVMVTLAVAVLSSLAFALLFGRSQRTQLIASVLLALLSVEYLPRTVPSTSPFVPGYVTALVGLPGPGGVLDLASGYSEKAPFGTNIGTSTALFYQTVHQRPMALGFMSRLPTSAMARFQQVRSLVNEKEFGILCRNFDYRYLVAPADRGGDGIPASARLVFADAVAGANVFDLAPDGRCVET